MVDETAAQNPAGEVLDSFLQPQRAPEEFNMVADAQKRFDSGTPRMPAPETPMRPKEEPETPEAPQLDGGDLLAASWFSHILQKDRAASEPARPAPPPGSFAHKLGAAIDTAGAALGDAAAGSAAPGGPLAGVAATLAARHSRQRGEAREDAQIQHQKRMDDINYAHAQVQTLIAQQTLRHAQAEDRKGALEYDQAIAADLDQVGTPVIKRQIDSDQLMQWMKDPANKDKVNGATAVIDHYLPADKNGYARPVYTLYDQVPDKINLSPKSADLLTKYGPTGEEIKPGSTMDGSVYIRAMKKATANQAAVAARDKLIAEAYKDNAEGRKAAEEAVNKLESRQALDRIASTMNQPGIRWDPTKALSLASKLQSAAKTPEEKAKADKFARDVEVGFGADLLEKERARTSDEQLRLMEMANMRKDRQLDRSQMTGTQQLMKDSEKFSATAKSMASTQANIDRAQSGDQLASSMAPLFMALGVTTSEDVRRINQNEIDRAGPLVGSYIRRVQGALAKAGTGTLPAETLREMKDMARSLQDIAYQQYIGVQLLNQKNNNLSGDTTFVLSSDGLSQVSLNEARSQAESNLRSSYAKQNMAPPGAKQLKNPKTNEIVAYTLDGGKTVYDIHTGQPYQAQ